MAETLIETLTRTEEGRRLFQQERAILEVTELICEIMEDDGVSRSELAKRLKKSKGYITQLLDGEANMTIRTISDVFVALGRTIHFQGSSADQDIGTTRRFDKGVWRDALGETKWPKQAKVAVGHLTITPVAQLVG